MEMQQVKQPDVTASAKWRKGRVCKEKVPSVVGEPKLAPDLVANPPPLLCTGKVPLCKLVKTSVEPEGQEMCRTFMK